MSQSSLAPEDPGRGGVEGVGRERGGGPPTGGGGASALKRRGKIFAMLSSKGEFVVKLPQQRVNALIARGDGERFDPGHGRLMKEWVCIEPDAAAEWLSLAREAMAFVAAKG